MSKLMMLIGPSGSGKSTLARLLGGVHLSSDAIREELWGDASDQRNGAEVFRVLNERTVATLKEGKDVVYDATNLFAKNRKALIEDIRAEVPGCFFEAYVCDTPLEECIARQDLRDRKVPVEVIERQYSRLQLPTLDEGWDAILKFKANAPSA